jgi:deoxyribose-phosphate aldolase
MNLDLEERMAQELKKEKEKVLASCDHTLLKQTATWKQVQALCDEAIRYHTAAVCIAPCFVRQAKEYVKDQMRVCTVIGFPNGNTTTAVKVYETKDAIQNGADEIDMVANIGWIKEGNYDQVKDEINAVSEACDGRILKVIVETCLLDKEEKIKVCETVSESRADYIKTSTGFSGGGATYEDIALLAEHVSNGTKIKAAGGIRSFEDAVVLMELGAERLGTSRLVGLM